MQDAIPEYDLLVVGGGVNGCGIAADAAGRGLRVALCEQSDLAAGTSSASTKLIHGGLRYLEYYEFSLVRQALAEREVLLQAAPHIVWPLRFRLPHMPGLRPRWMLRAGLFLYDHLSRRNRLAGSRSLRLGGDSPLKPELRHAFEYSDCWVDDSRLVVLNAMQAAGRGACIMTRTRCVETRPVAKGWQVTLEDCNRSERHQLQARALVNATGPWVDRFAAMQGESSNSRSVRLVKGSHIVVPRLYAGNEAYMLQHVDRRIVFVIPWEGDFSLIGTTEEKYDADPAAAGISADEQRYLLRVVNENFRARLSTGDILHSFAGVRPLLEGESDDSTSLSRDYTLDFENDPAPLLTVHGGKITTYRRLAEAALQSLKPIFPDMGPEWTANAVLPGGEFADQATLFRELATRHPWLPDGVLGRWVRSYGRCIEALLGDASRLEDLGTHWGHGLYDRELQYLESTEWAQTAADVLWRRSKLGLRFSKAEVEALEQRMRSVL